jgi:hypothetical protein
VCKKRLKRAYLSDKMSVFLGIKNNGIMDLTVASLITPKLLIGVM